MNELQQNMHSLKDQVTIFLLKLLNLNYFVSGTKEIVVVFWNCSKMVRASILSLKCSRKMGIKLKRFLIAKKTIVNGADFSFISDGIQCPQIRADCHFGCVPGHVPPGCNNGIP
jgi:hypothetical protein